jgi:hypothetical protein
MNFFKQKIRISRIGITIWSIASWKLSTRLIFDFCDYIDSVEYIDNGKFIEQMFDLLLKLIFLEVKLKTFQSKFKVATE